VPSVVHGITGAAAKRFSQTAAFDSHEVVTPVYSNSACRFASSIVSCNVSLITFHSQSHPNR
jgi:hypothetical protein